MSIEFLAASDAPFMGGNIHACPLRGHSTSFQLVDEFGDGKPYAGLTYEIIDYEDIVYTGKLDATGSGKLDNHYCGPVVLKLNQLFKGSEALYKDLRARPHYPLPITELQVRAEKSRFFNKSVVRTQANPAKDLANANAYYQIEVSELVQHIAHLPPVAFRSDPPNMVVHTLMRQPAKTRAFTIQNPGAPGWRDERCRQPDGHGHGRAGICTATAQAKGHRPASEQTSCAGSASDEGTAPNAVDRQRVLRAQPLSTGADVDVELHRLWSGAEHTTPTTPPALKQPTT